MYYHLPSSLDKVAAAANVVSAGCYNGSSLKVQAWWHQSKRQIFNIIEVR
jgi:hypothetical protein